jgi:hypothetical protein
MSNEIPMSNVKTKTEKIITKTRKIENTKEEEIRMEHFELLRLGF